MKTLFDYIKNFAFKNFFALLLVPYMLWMVKEDPTLKDLLIVLITLIIKHFFDSNTGSQKKDETISTLANNQQAGNTTVQNAETVNVDKQ